MRSKTALHLVCADGKGTLGVFKALCNIGIDFNAQDEDGQTVLHLAILNDNADIYHWLIANRHELKIDLFIKDDFGRTVADLVLCKKPGRIKADLMQMFDEIFWQEHLSTDTEDNLKNHFARHKLSDYEIARFRNKNRASGENLIALAKQGDFVAIRALQNIKHIVNYQDDSGYTALYFAVCHNCWQDAQYLLDNGASLSMCYAKNRFPLNPLIIQETLSDVTVEFFKNIQNLNNIDGLLSATNIPGFIEAFVSKHVIDRRFEPTHSDSLIYHKFYSVLKSTQIMYLLYTCSQSIRPLELSSGCLMLLKHTLCAAIDSLQTEQELLHDALKPVQVDKLGIIKNHISNILAWHDENFTQLQAKVIQEELCHFEIVYKYANRLFMGIVAINGNKLSLTLPYASGVITEKYTINNRAGLLHELRMQFGKINELLIFKNILHKYTIADAAKPSTTPFCDRFSLLFSAVGFCFFESSDDYAALLKIVLRYNFLLLSKQLPSSLLTQAKFSSSLPLVDIKDIIYDNFQRNINEILNDLKAKLDPKVLVTLKKGTSHVVGRAPRLSNFNFIDLPFPDQTVTIAELIEVLNDVNYGVAYLQQYEVGHNYEWILNHAANYKIIGLDLGIMPDVLAASWVTAAHIPGLYLGIKPEILRCASIEKLRILARTGDPNVLLSGKYHVHKSNLYIRFYLLQEIINTTYAQGINLYYNNAAQLWLHSILSSNAKQNVSREVILSAAVSFEKLAYYMLDVKAHFNSDFYVRFEDIANQAAVAAACVKYGLKQENCSWRDLVCFLHQISQEQLNLALYDNTQDKLHGLNNIQRTGLLLGLAYNMVTSPGYNSEYLAKFVYFHPMTKFNARQLQGFEEFKRSKADLLTVDGPYKYTDALQASDLFAPTNATAWKFVVPSVPKQAPAATIEPAAVNSANTAITLNEIDPIDKTKIYEFAAAGSWDKVRLMLLAGADLYADYDNGKSPLEYIAFCENIDAEYIKLLRCIAETLFARKDYNLKFYSEYNFFYPFIGALASSRPLLGNLVPTDSDSEAYKYFYKIIRVMQLKSMLHYQFEMQPWYDSVEGVANKPTGSFGRLMQSEYLAYHRAYCLDSPRTEYYLKKFKYIDNDMPDAQSKIEARQAELRIDTILKDYLPTSRSNWNKLEENIRSQVPVAFEIQIMMDFFAHNLNALISGDKLYIADRSRGFDSITLYKILDREQLIQQLRYVFGSRVESICLEEFEDHSCIEQVHSYELPRQTAFNCTFASMDALYHAIVLDTFVPDALDKHNVYEVMNGVQAWGTAVRNYAVYHTVLTLNRLMPNAYEGLKLINFLPSLSDSKYLYKNANMFDALSSALKSYFAARLEQNARHAGIDLSRFNLSVKSLNSTRMNYVYDLGPAVLQNLIDCNDEELCGINYGLKREDVKEAGYNVLHAKPMLFYPKDKVRNLSEHKLHALREGLRLEDVQQPWFRLHHTYFFLEAGISDIEKLALISLWHVECFSDKKLTIEEALEHRNVSASTLVALKMEMRRLLKDDLLRLPGRIGLGLESGLSAEQVLNPEFSEIVALLVNNGIAYDNALKLNRKEALTILRGGEYAQLPEYEISDELLLLLTYAGKKIKFVDLCNTAAARRFAVRNGCPYSVYAAEDFSWVQALCHSLGLDADVLKCTRHEQILRIIAKLADVEFTPADLKFNAANYALRTLVPEIIAKDDEFNYSDEQLLCIYYGMTGSEVRSAWFSEMHYLAVVKYGINSRTLVGKDAATVQQLLPSHNPSILEGLKTVVAEVISKRRSSPIRVMRTSEGQECFLCNSTEDKDTELVLDFDPDDLDPHSAPDLRM